MASDLKTYAQELFKKANLDGNEKAKAILEALGDDSIQQAFRNGFVETPQHHSTVDRIKGEWETKATAAEQKVKQYDDWYNNQAKPAFDTYKQAQDALQQYQSLYGPIQSGAEVRQAAASTGLTKEEVMQMLQQKDQAYVGLSKDLAYITVDHVQRFKEPVDLDALEAYALKSGLPLRQAYKDYVAPKLEEQRNQEFEAKLKAAREEGYKDAMSKNHLPVESGPRESHLVFDRKAPETPLNEMQQERVSRDAFLEGWNNYNADAKAS